MRVVPCLVLLSVGTNGLSSSQSPRKPVKRVAVVGTGIAGLSVAHALTNSPSLRDEYGPFDFDVSIFEARKKMDTKAGAGVQLNGGLVALGKINKKVQRAVIDAGLPVAGIQSRSKPWYDGRPFEELLQLNIGEMVRNAGKNGRHDLIQDGELLWSAIMRGCLQETLYKTLPPQTRRKIKFSKLLVDLKPQTDGSVLCEFSDGTAAGPFDLVVGCDGVKSPCKEYIETGKISADPSNRKSAALYSGLRIRYAVDDEFTAKNSPESSKSATLTQYFGDGANVLDGKYGNGAGRPSSKIAFFVYLDKETAESAKLSDENVDWREVEKQNRERSRKNMTEDIQKYSVPSTNVVPTVKAADRFFDRGIYFHSPFSFVGWSKTVAKDGAVVALCGDAARTIPPFLGQGANQAIQDAYCMVTKLYEYNANVAQGIEGPSVDKLLKDYQRTRWFHTFLILLNTCFLGYLETGGDNGFYAKFRDLFFKTTGTIGVAQLVLLSSAVPKF